MTHLLDNASQQVAEFVVDAQEELELAIAKSLKELDKNEQDERRNEEGILSLNYTESFSPPEGQNNEVENQIWMNFRRILQIALLEIKCKIQEREVPKSYEDEEPRITELIRTWRNGGIKEEDKSKLKVIWMQVRPVDTVGVDAVIEVKSILLYLLSIFYGNEHGPDFHLLREAAKDFGIETNESLVLGMKMSLFQSAAHYNLGVLFDAGIGCISDPIQSHFHYLVAAITGRMRKALYNLGRNHFRGKSLKENKTFAIWCWKMAAREEPHSCYILSECYWDGVGVKIQPSLANHYFEIAENLGVPRQSICRKLISAFLPQNVSLTSTIQLLMNNCSRGLFQEVSSLLDKFPEIINEKDQIRATPLFYAAASHNPSVVALLLERGACIDFINSKEQSVLDIAAAARRLPAGHPPVDVPQPLYWKATIQVDQVLQYLLVAVMEGRCTSKSLGICPECRNPCSISSKLGCIDCDNICYCSQQCMDLHIDHHRKMCYHTTGRNLLHMMGLHSPDVILSAILPPPAHEEYLLKGSSLLQLVAEGRILPIGLSGSSSMISPTEQFPIRIFISHRWCNEEHPDPTGAQIQTLLIWIVATIVRTVIDLYPSMKKNFTHIFCRESLDLLPEKSLASMMRESLSMVLTEDLIDCDSPDHNSKQSLAYLHLLIQDLIKPVSFFGVTTRFISKLSMAFLKRVGFWIDYSCLPQRPDRGADPRMNTLFKESLNRIDKIQQGKLNILLWDSHCEDRGWCITESIAAVPSNNPVVFIPCPWRPSIMESTSEEFSAQQPRAFIIPKMPSLMGTRQEIRLSCLFWRAYFLFDILDNHLHFLRIPKRLGVVGGKKFGGPPFHCTNGTDREVCLEIMEKHHENFSNKSPWEPLFHDLDSLTFAKKILSRHEFPILVLENLLLLPAHVTKRVLEMLQKLESTNPSNIGIPTIGEWYKLLREYLKIADEPFLNDISSGKFSNPSGLFNHPTRELSLALRLFSANSVDLS